MYHERATPHHHDVTGQVLFTRRSSYIFGARVRRRSSALHDEHASQSLAQGRLPTSQKHAIVKPFLKKTGLDTADTANFRPVSNLSFMSKVVSVRQQFTTVLPVSVSEETLD